MLARQLRSGRLTPCRRNLDADALLSCRNCARDVPDSLTKPAFCLLFQERDVLIEPNHVEHLWCSFLGAGPKRLFLIMAGRWLLQAPRPGGSIRAAQTHTSEGPRTGGARRLRD